MAGYSFETITADQAASFQATDYLFFQSATAQQVTVAPYSTSFGGSGTTISYGGKSVTFPDTISTASQSNHILFTDNSSLIIGSNSGTAETLGNTGATVNTVVYGLNGNDTINLGATTSDYVYGGVGNDTIGAATANGNYHIYGNAAGAAVALSTGQTDVDTITVGTGSSYIQGNAGADTITAGTAASTGYNRIFGGADADTINVNGGVGSVAIVNGNKGDDIINVAGSGSNFHITNGTLDGGIRGGQGNDTITQTGTNHSALYGDAGNDHLIVSGTAGHVAILTGGADADVFDFSVSGAGAVAHLNSDGSVATANNNGAYAAGTLTYYQEVTDFGNGADTVHLSFTPTAANIFTSSTNFASVADAQTFAQTQLGTSANSVSALSVGGSTYVFYHLTANSTTADGVIHMDNVATTAITTATFS